MSIITGGKAKILIVNSVHRIRFNVPSRSNNLENRVSIGMIKCQNKTGNDFHIFCSICSLRNQNGVLFAKFIIHSIPHHMIISGLFRSFVMTNRLPKLVKWIIAWIKYSFIHSLYYDIICLNPKNVRGVEDERTKVLKVPVFKHWPYIDLDTCSNINYIEKLDFSMHVMSEKNFTIVCFTIINEK